VCDLVPIGASLADSGTLPRTGDDSQREGPRRTLYAGPIDVQRVSSGFVYESSYGYCRAVRAGDRVFVSGTAPVPPAGEELAAGAYRQMLRCCEIAVAALERCGAGTADVVRTRMYITDLADADEVGRAHAEVFGANPPATAMVVVAGLLDPGWKVELEVDAIVAGA